MIGYSPFGSPDLPWGRTDLSRVFISHFLIPSQFIFFFSVLRVHNLRLIKTPDLPHILADPTLKDIAARVGKSTAQGQSVFYVKLKKQLFSGSTLEYSRRSWNMWQICL